MQIEKIQFDNIRYNPEISAFETLVRIEDDGQSYSYPVHVTAPLHAEYGLVTRGLAQAARRAHGSNHPALRLAHAKTVANVPPRTENSLLDRLFGTHAA